MLVMIVRPMTADRNHSNIVSVQYPINIGYLVSYLKQHNIDCAVSDFEVEPYVDEKFLESISLKKLSLIGFSCMTPHVMHAAHMAKIVKEHFPGILTVIGGVHATAIPKQTIEEFPQFDIVALGEGERVLLDICEKFSNSEDVKTVRGIAFKDGDEVRINQRMPFIEDLDSIPFPDRKLIEMKYYKRSHVSRGFSRQVINIAEITCSRGCPYNCIFCASKVIHSKIVRFRSAANIIAEMDALIGEHDIEHFSFLDDTFTIKNEILKPVCSYMESRKVTFDCFTRVNDIDEEKMAAMVAAGCKKISFGIESGSARILKLLKKGITLDQVDKAFRISRKAGLPAIEATFMVGAHPDETMEDVEMTKKLIYKLRPDILGIFIAIPYPGTELNSILKERGLLLKENWNEFRLFLSTPSWESGNVPMKKLQQVLRDIVYGYYLNPSYLLSSLAKIKSYKEFMYLAGLGFSLIKTKISMSYKNS